MFLSITTDIELGFGLGESIEEEVQIVKFGNGTQEDFSFSDLELGFGAKKDVQAEDFDDEDEEFYDCLTFAKDASVSKEELDGYGRWLEGFFKGCGGMLLILVFIGCMNRSMGFKIDHPLPILSSWSTVDSEFDTKSHLFLSAMIRIGSNTGFSPPQSKTRKICNESEIVLTATSIANASTTTDNNKNYNNNDSDVTTTIRKNASSDTTVSSVDTNSITATNTTIIGNNDDTGMASDITNTNGGKGTNGITGISTRTRSSAEKCTRRMPARNYYHHQQQQQQ